VQFGKHVERTFVPSRVVVLRTFQVVFAVGSLVALGCR
jgi:hypothetical protein